MPIAIVRNPHKAQLSLLEANLTRSDGQSPAVQCAARRREDLPENMLESQIRDFLAWRGFITIRQHVGAFVPLRVVRQLQQGQISFDQAMCNIVKLGEEGASDWWSARPIIPPGGRPLDGPHPWQAFFWEAKAPHKKATESQLAWIDKRRQCGLEATWFNQFGFRDRPAPVVDARESPVFEVWWTGYFARRERP
jgi:hypothetical protein